MLTGNGYRVIAVKNPMDAIKVCEERNHPFQLLLTDVVMPEMDGYHLVKRIREITPAMRIIFMSGYTEPSVIKRALTLNAAFLQKPLVVNSILSKIREVLDAAPSAVSAENSTK